MGEARLGGIYGGFDAIRAVTELDDDVEVGGLIPGPAGLSMVAFPDGSTWSVDYADPTSLISAVLPKDGVADSPLAIALFGPDGALFLADRDARRSRSTPPDSNQFAVMDSSGRWRRRAKPRRDRRTTRPARAPGPANFAVAGLLVVTMDDAFDPGVDPLVRIAAAAEFLRVLPNMPVGPLFNPMADESRSLIDHLVATHLDDLTQDIDDLSEYSLNELHHLLASTGSVDGGSVSLSMERFLRSVGARLEEDRDDAVGRFPAMAMPNLECAFPVDHAGIAPPPALQIERLDDLRIQITAPMQVGVAWARVVRRRDLVTLALVPLERWELALTGIGVLPFDVGIDDVAVVLQSDRDLAGSLSVADASGATLVRRAIRFGRAATRAARTGDIERAQELWGDCAAAWKQCGDNARVELALDYQNRALGRLGRLGPPLLAERVTRELGLDEFD